LPFHADVAELVDAQVSEACGLKPVMVRSHSSANLFVNERLGVLLVSITTTDEDIIQRVSLIFEVKYQKVRKRQEHWKQSYTIRIYGRKAVELMKKMRPVMSQRRQEQIDTAIKSYHISPNRGASKLTIKQIRKVKKLLLQNNTCREIAKNLFENSQTSAKRINLIASGANPTTRIY
jgi:hypothetical protein